MSKISCKLTVYFEDPYWVGVYERTCGGRLEACKITFGAEPRDYQVYGYLLENWHRLRFSPPIKLEERNALRKPHRNPKRVQREVSRQLSGCGAGTRSQQALQLQRENTKADRKSLAQRRREEEKQRRFLLRSQKRKEKKRGH